MPKPVLHLISGKIASGKSMLAKSLAVEGSTVLLSEDHWLSRLYPEPAFFKVVVASTIQLCGLLHVLLFSIRVQQHGTNRLPVASAS